jgi:hypothetical protein
MKALTEEQVTKIILTEVEKNFPKDCACCGYRFHTYKELLQGAHPLGAPQSHDATIEDWRPQDPLGFLAYWSCGFCSNTLTTNINSLEIEATWQLLSWIKKKMKKRGVSSELLLSNIRERMMAQAFGEEQKLT